MMVRPVCPLARLPVKPVGFIEFVGFVGFIVFVAFVGFPEFILTIGSAEAVLHVNFLTKINVHPFKEVIALTGKQANGLTGKPADTKDVIP
jgi:hypothetical protein